MQARRSIRGFRERNNDKLYASTRIEVNLAWYSAVDHIRINVVTIYWGLLYLVAWLYDYSLFPLLKNRGIEKECATHSSPAEDRGASQVLTTYIELQ